MNPFPNEEATEFAIAYFSHFFVFLIISMKSINPREVSGTGIRYNSQWLEHSLRVKNGEDCSNPSIFTYFIFNTVIKIRDKLMLVMASSYYRCVTAQALLVKIEKMNLNLK